MVLIFGGTTEGRKASEVLEEAGSPYFYSTKTGEQDISLQHGQRIDGALDAEGMTAFIKAHDIRLIVDAAHPFASQLHQTIIAVASEINIPVVRYERIYPPRDPDITWIDDYSQIPTDIHTLLATTGVQSISKLKPLETQGIKVYYRILPRVSSIRIAHQQGAADDQLLFYNEEEPIPSSLSGDDWAESAILLKESGLSGGFPEKVAAARKRGMRIIALTRPQFPFFGEEGPGVEVINGPYGLRRAVEHLLPDFYPLHSGLTTGTCATAAAIAATLRLLKNETPKEVPVILPNGETIHVPVSYGPDYASCIKEAGDDPDVTNGIEIRATITPLPGRRDRGDLNNQIEILGGEGVGTITLPGFDYPPGSPAINKAPREMICQNLEPFGKPLQVTISVPEGADIARRTFNPRLGIEGGISISGVSGIVKPFSEEAFIDSIRKCVTIALASGTDRIVINSGGKSERFVKALYPDLPKQAFVEYGNYIGETLKIITELSKNSPIKTTLGVMLGKAVKLAAGHLDTHSRKTTMDLDFIQQMLQESGITINISTITLARELWERIPAHQLGSFAQTVIRHCFEHCSPLLSEASLTILLIDDNGKIYE